MRTISLNLTPHKRVPSNPDEIRVNCPFCQSAGKAPDTKYHLYINLRNKVYHCFRCGISGRLSDGSLANFLITKPDNSKVESPCLIPLSEAKDGVIGSKAVRYLRSRGMYDLSRFYLGLKGRWYGRIAVPVKERDRVVGWIGRAFLKGVEPKYMISPNFKSSEHLFNLFESLSQPQIFLVEGIFDALSISGGVALMGKEMSNVQLVKILTYVEEDKPIYVALDGDAVKEARRIAGRLAFCRDNVYLVGYRGCKDMNEVLIGKGTWYVKDRLS